MAPAPIFQSQGESIAMTGRPDQFLIYEWFSRWRSPLRRFLASRGKVRAADLDDMSQEVFLRLLRYSDAEVIECPQAYLFKIAFNVATEWGIRPGTRLAHDSRWLDELAVEDRIEQSLDQGAFEQRMKEALMQLTTRERAVIKLHFEEGLTRKRIASRLGVTERVVKRDFETSYAKLRHELDRDKAAHHD